MTSEPAVETSAARPMPVNMYATSEAVVVVAVTPAVTPSDLTVERRGRVLHLRSRLRNAALRDYILHEWSYGDYERDLELPEGFAGPVHASLANGQLVVRVLAGVEDGSKAKPVTVSAVGQH